MLGTSGIILVIILLAVCTLVCWLVVLLSGAVIFSRISFALLAALVANQSGAELVRSSAFLNYIAWFVVVLGVVFALSTLPRVEVALKLLCTVFMSTVIVQLVICFVGALLAAKSGELYHMSVFHEILGKLVCTAFSVMGMVQQKKKEAFDSPRNPILHQLERLLASLMYGVTIAFLCISLQGNWEIGVAGQLLIVAAGTAAAFIGDIFLAGKDIFGMRAAQTATVPR